jgi:hypothetical protein
MNKTEHKPSGHEIMVTINIAAVSIYIFVKVVFL